MLRLANQHRQSGNCYSAYLMNLPFMTLVPQILPALACLYALKQLDHLCSTVFLLYGYFYGRSIRSRWTLYFAAVVTVFFLLFFLAYSQRLQIGCLPYFHTRCGLSANLECRSEMYCTCTRFAQNTGRKNYAKNRRLRTIAQLCRAVSSQQRRVSTIGTIQSNPIYFQIASVKAS